MPVISVVLCAAGCQQLSWYFKWVEIAIVFESCDLQIEGCQQLSWYLKWVEISIVFESCDL